MGSFRINVRKKAEKEEVRKGAELIKEVYSEKNNFFSTLPVELVIKIAASIADNNHLNEDDATEVARSIFSKSS